MKFEFPPIEYCNGYKYQLRNTVFIQTPIRPDHAIFTDLVELHPSGLLTIRKYFAWDGCTFPAIDTKTNIRAGLIHDALYYLMRIGGLDMKWRSAADELLRQVMLKDGSWSVRANYFFHAVRLFAEKYASPQNARVLYVAP